MRKAVAKRRLEEGLETRQQLNLEKTREKEYSIFNVENTDHGDPRPGLTEFYGIVNVVVGLPKDYNSRSNSERFPNQPEDWIPRNQPRYFPHKSKQMEVHLKPEDLSLALVHIFAWTSQEVVRFNDKNWIKKNCEWKEGILIRKGRILENHEISIAGGAEKFVNIGQITGINFCVPVIDRYSPWAVSFAEHIH